MTRSSDAPEYVGFASLPSGETKDIYRGEPEHAEKIRSGGAIFTTLDMPSLEQLFAENADVIIALERPLPAVATEPTEQQISARQRTPAVAEADVGPFAMWRVLVASFIATAVMIAGAVLLALSFASEHVTPNPYAALALTLGGGVLLGTLVLALRGYRIQ